MVNVPKKANDALHLSMLEGCDIRIEELGDVILQDTLHVLDFKQLIKKSRERHCFLFELYLVFSKEIKDSSGRVKYLYKSKLMVSEDVRCAFYRLFYARLRNCEKQHRLCSRRRQSWELPST